MCEAKAHKLRSHTPRISKSQEADTRIPRVDLEKSLVRDIQILPPPLLNADSGCKPLDTRTRRRTLSSLLSHRSRKMVGNLAVNAVTPACGPSGLQSRCRLDGLLCIRHFSVYFTMQMTGVKHLLWSCIGYCRGSRRQVYEMRNVHCPLMAPTMVLARRKKHKLLSC